MCVNSLLGPVSINIESHNAQPSVWRHSDSDSLLLYLHVNEHALVRTPDAVTTFVITAGQFSTYILGAVMLAQWCQPTSYITHNEISEKLDDIADQVREELGIRYPGHPALDRLPFPLLGKSLDVDTR